MKKRARSNKHHLEIIMRRYERAEFPCDHSPERVAHCRDVLGIRPVCASCGLLLES